MTRTLTRALANLPQSIVSVQDFGAVGDGVTDDTAAIQAAINAYPSNAVIDFANKSYKITAAIVVNNSMSLTLQNGTLVQDTEAENILQIAGSYCARLTLQGFNLTHTSNSAAAGNCFDVAATVSNFNFFRWVGGTVNKGYYGIRTRGSTWMAHFERVWVLSPYSSGWYMPASGDTVSNSQLGGSTTTKLYKCFVTDVQTYVPAYAIGTGYDTLVLEQCAADRCWSFGYFKANPIRLESCSSEQVKNPPVGALTTIHRVIEFGSGSDGTIDGFHVTFDSPFTAPVPPGGAYNSLFYLLNSQVNITGIRGSIPATYYMLDQEGGTTFVNGSNLGQGVRTISGGVSRSPSNISVANRTALSGTTNGNSAPTTLWNFEAGNNVYILTTTYSYGGNASTSTWLVFTSSSQSKGTAVKLMSGPDYSTSVNISIVGTTVEYSTSINLFSDWQAFKLTLEDY